MATQFPTDAELHRAATELVERERCSYVEAVKALVNLAELINKPVKAASAALDEEGELDGLLNAFTETFGGNYIRAVNMVTELASARGLSLRDAAMAALKDSALYNQADAFSRQHGVDLTEAIQVLAAASKLRKK